ncbi:MAG: tRNA (adenosine(37)-N6)-threonylcarbamoyltransferase complex dimerization subunit type 1 TsaB [Nocardioidaceae bacterium]
MLLAFDTATPAVTVALHDGTSVLAESTVVGGLRHAELLAPGIARVLAAAALAPNDLTEIAVGVGPGPFTGLRVGIVTARTMSAVLGIPVVGVCTLDAVAAAAEAEGDILDGGFLVATDARRKEVYWARYSSPVKRLTDPAVDKPAAIATSMPVAGRGPVLYPDEFPHAIAPEHPSATNIARLVAAGQCDLFEPEPLYLRRPDVAQPGPRKPVG